MIQKKQKQGRVFICRLFQRSYYDEHSSSENTIQWTILLFVWLSALFPLHFCTDCTVMYASDPAAHIVLSPDTGSILTESYPFETYLSTSSSTIWSVWWSEKGLFHPCSHPALFRFPIPIMSGFYSSGAFNDLWLDPSKYPKLWFITSHYVLNCGKYSIVTALSCDLTVSGGVCTFLSSSWSIIPMSADESEKFENHRSS